MIRLLIDGDLPDSQYDVLQAAAHHAATVEGVKVPCYVQVALTDDRGIAALNTAHRGINRPTDVLSFPSIDYPAGDTAGQAEQLLLEEWDADLGASFLGDIIISLPRAREQATQYGHPYERELCYLLVHGLFHLMGYDHQMEEDKRNMRDKEEETLGGIGQIRNMDDVLLQAAREAMKTAYAPYSGFRVGACLQAEDGTLYTGCNVENASFGLTNCGERTAVFKAISEGKRRFSAIAIAADQHAPWPCGACRQVLSEFAPDLRVLITWDDGQVAESTLKDLLPHSFSPATGADAHLLGKERHG